MTASVSSANSGSNESGTIDLGSYLRQPPRRTASQEVIEVEKKKGRKARRRSLTASMSLRGNNANKKKLNKSLYEDDTTVCTAQFSDAGQSLASRSPPEAKEVKQRGRQYMVRRASLSVFMPSSRRSLAGGNGTRSADTSPTRSSNEELSNRTSRSTQSHHHFTQSMTTTSAEQSNHNNSPIKEQQHPKNQGDYFPGLHAPPPLTTRPVQVKSSRRPRSNSHDESTMLAMLPEAVAAREQQQKERPTMRRRASLSNVLGGGGGGGGNKGLLQRRNSAENEPIAPMNRSKSTSEGMLSSLAAPFSPRKKASKTISLDSVVEDKNLFHHHHNNNNNDLLVAALQSLQQWVTVGKEQARMLIQETMDELYEIRQEATDLQEHSLEFVAARLESNNTIGAVLSMKQYYKYVAQQLQIQDMLQQLVELDDAVQDSQEAILDMAVRINAIREHTPVRPLPQASEPNHVILQLAQEKLQELNQ